MAKIQHPATLQILLTLTGALVCMSPAAAQIALSEIRTDQPGSDVDEYFELAGPAGTSLAGHTYLVIGDGAGGSGVLEAAIALDSLQIPPDGVAFVGEASFSLGPTPDLVAVLNFENADNVTHLLVAGFSGAVGFDLDPDDDGVLDETPWDQVIDCLAILDSSDSGDLIYCDETVGPDGSAAPAHVYLDGGWQIGPPDPSLGVDTPGTLPVGLAVQVSGFRAVARGSDVLLSWTSAGTNGDETYTIRENGRLIATISSHDAIEARSAPEKRYSFTLRNAAPGPHPLQLFLLSSGGVESHLASTVVELPYGDNLVVHGPFPNPAGSNARIEVISGIHQTLSMALFDAVGRRLEEYDPERVLAGEKKPYSVDLTAHSAGLYFLSIRGRGETVTKGLAVFR